MGSDGGGDLSDAQERFRKPFFGVRHHKLGRLPGLEVRQQHLAHRRLLHSGFLDQRQRLLPAAGCGEMAGIRLGDTQIGRLLVVDGTVGFVGLSPASSDIGHERPLNRLEMDGPGGFRGGLQRSDRLVRMPKRQGGPRTRQLYRRIVRGRSALRGFEVLVRRPEIVVPVGIDAQEDMSDGIIRLAPDQALRQTFRLGVIARRQPKLERLIEDVLVAGILGEGPAVVKRRVITIACCPGEMAREIAAKQRGAVDGFRLRKRPALGPERLCPGRTAGHEESERNQGPSLLQGR